MRLIIAAAIILSLLIVLYLTYRYKYGSSAAAPTPSGTAVVTTRTYTFYPNKDSAGNDITQKADLKDNVTGLQQACDSTPGCLGFNTNGWMKSVIIPQASWSTWGTSPSQGLYVAN